MSRTKKNVHKIRNEVFTHYFSIYSQIATQLFKWDGLPEDLPAEFIEKMLFENGSILITHHDMVGVFATRYVNSGQVDMYDRPTHYLVVNNSGLNGMKVQFDEGVVIKNNSNMQPTKLMIKKNIDELVELHITKINNTSWQRIPLILQGNSQTAQSLKSLIETTLEGGQAMAIADKSLNIDAVHVIDTRTQYLGKELREETKMVTGELLTILGINNLEVSKNERLVAAEAEVNKEEVNINLLSFLEPRLKAAEMINEVFGLNVSVGLNKEIFTEEVDLKDENDNIEGTDTEV